RTLSPSLERVEALRTGGGGDLPTHPAGISRRRRALQRKRSAVADRTLRLPGRKPSLPGGTDGAGRAGRLHLHLPGRSGTGTPRCRPGLRKTAGDGQVDQGVPRRPEERLVLPPHPFLAALGTPFSRRGGNLSARAGAGLSRGTDGADRTDPARA